MSKKTYKVEHKCENCGATKFLDIPFGKDKYFHITVEYSVFEILYYGATCDKCGCRTLGPVK